MKKTLLNAALFAIAMSAATAFASAPPAATPPAAAENVKPKLDKNAIIAVYPADIIQYGYGAEQLVRVETAASRRTAYMTKVYVRLADVPEELLAQK